MNQDPQAKEINLAVIGGGRFAQRYHVPALLHIRDRGSADYRLNLRGIYRRNHALAREQAGELGFQRAYPSLQALLSDPVVNAVAVVVPPAALAELLPPVVAAGLPVFTEKPPGVSYQEARRFAELVTVPNLVAFNRRFAPLNQRFKAMVSALDDTFFVEGSFLRSRRDDKDFTIATASHWINFMEYLFGEIAAVHNRPLGRAGQGDESRLASLTFADGLTGSLKIFPDCGAQSERLCVYSRNKILYLHGPLFLFDSGRIMVDEAWENPDRPELRFQQTIIPETKRTTILAPTDVAPIIELGFVAQFEEFFEAICFGTPTRSNFQNSVNTMRVAEAIQGQAE